MNTNNNFEVRYTLRLYDDSIITELKNQFDKLQETYKNKNEFLAHILELGLAANRKSIKSGAKKKYATEPEESELYQLILEIYKYTSKQFRKIYIDHNIMQKLLSSMYNILLANNSNEQLFEEKIEDGFYDDLPSRFSNIILDLSRQYGLE